MSVINKSENVKKQYTDDRNLSIRIGLHSKYSTNKLGLASWLFNIYEFSGTQRILELGCGNGAQWEKKFSCLPSDCVLALSDFSEGMVKKVREKYKNHKNLIVQKIDIQDIPFPRDTFDIVIANHMLYHVPDLNKAISEVKRVMKDTGTFYCTTNGNGGMKAYLHAALKHIGPDTKAFSEDYSFSLQNGYEILSKHFVKVKRIDYEDSLLITETQDLINWMKSSLTISGFSEKDFEGLYSYFENIRKKNGAIEIPKEIGIFISNNC